VAGEKQLGRCSAEQYKYYRLDPKSGKLTLAAMYLQRVQVAGFTFAAALANVFNSCYAAGAWGT
jgi:hypothetical protein